MNPHRSGPMMAAVLTASVAAAFPASAQQSDGHRTRVALGPQLVPSYPGADRISVRPLVDVARARGEERFAFEAPDESFGFSLPLGDRVTIGPAIGFEGSRGRADVGGRLPKVGFTVEVGGFVQYQLSEAVRARVELRQGIGGHRGLVANFGADYVARRGDDWLFSIGPRLTLANARYDRAYFGVSRADAAASGLAAFRPDGGLESVGITAGYIRQLTPRWGIYSYAKYDRLIADPARSPIVDRYGSKDQPSAGIGLTYTFGSGVDR